MTYGLFEVSFLYLDERILLVINHMQLSQSANMQSLP